VTAEKQVQRCASHVTLAKPVQKSPLQTWPLPMT